MQEKALREYAKHRGWKITQVVTDIASGAKKRPQREILMQAARRRQIDAIAVWKLDRWGRSVVDLIGSLRELNDLGIVFVSLTEALDLGTATGRAFAGMLSVFAEFERETIRERVLAGQAHARSKGVQFGRPRTVALQSAEVLKLQRKRVPKAEIARRLGIPRTSVIRIVAATQ
jgi:putative DNA-invertase from lambdoid prophage Rac